MTNKELGVLVSKMCDNLKATLTSKGLEYSLNDDRLINFYEAADMNGSTPEQALWGFVTKHIIALKDFIVRDANRIEVPEEQWDEKIGDIIAYMCLLKALREDNKAEATSEGERWVIYHPTLGKWVAVGDFYTTKESETCICCTYETAAAVVMDDEVVMSLQEARERGLN